MYNRNCTQFFFLDSVSVILPFSARWWPLVFGKVLSGRNPKHWCRLLYFCCSTPPPPPSPSTFEHPLHYTSVIFDWQEVHVQQYVKLNDWYQEKRLLLFSRNLSVSPAEPRETLRFHENKIVQFPRDQWSDFLLVDPMWKWQAVVSIHGQQCTVALWSCLQCCPVWDIHSFHH